MTCHLEYPLKVERHGAFRRRKARPCESLRAITPASVAVRCVALVGAVTSAEPPVVIAISVEEMAAVAEATVVAAAGKEQRCCDLGRPKSSGDRKRFAFGTAVGRPLIAPKKIRE